MAKPSIMFDRFHDASPRRGTVTLNGDERAGSFMAFVHGRREGFSRELDATEDGAYVVNFIALGGFTEPVIPCDTQPCPEVLAVAITGDACDEAVLAIARRMLGTERDVTDFDRRARRMPWLTPIARRMRGIKPPRYPTLWEACVNTIVFQQISLQAASLHHAASHSSAERLGGVRRPFARHLSERETIPPMRDAAIPAVGMSAGKFAAAPAKRSLMVH
jgi:hypothetical protein